MLGAYSMLSKQRFGWMMGWEILVVWFGFRERCVVVWCHSLLGGVAGRWFLKSIGESKRNDYSAVPPRDCFFWFKRKPSKSHIDHRSQQQSYIQMYQLLFVSSRYVDVCGQLGFGRELRFGGVGQVLDAFVQVSGKTPSIRQD